MTTDPTPSPDVRELAIRTIVAIIDEKAKQRRAGWTTSARRAATEYADAVLAAVSPVIRRQERAKIGDEIEGYAEEIGWYEGSGVWADAIEIARGTHVGAAAIARTHAHPKEITEEDLDG